MLASRAFLCSSRSLFVSSKEEFREIFDADPQIEFPERSPEFERDVSFSDITNDRLQERFVEAIESFPKEQTIDAMRKSIDQSIKPKSDSNIRSIEDLRHICQPSISISISISELREKADGVK